MGRSRPRSPTVLAFFRRARWITLRTLGGDLRGHGELVRSEQINTPDPIDHSTWLRVPHARGADRTRDGQARRPMPSATAVTPHPRNVRRGQNGRPSRWTGTRRPALPPVSGGRSDQLQRLLLLTAARRRRLGRSSADEPAVQLGLLDLVVGQTSNDLRGPPPSNAPPLPSRGQATGRS